MPAGDREPLARKVGAYLRYSHLGMQFILSIGLPLAGGLWLDKKLGTRVLFTLLGFALGFGAGTYTLCKEVFKKRQGFDPDSTDSTESKRADGPESEQE